ncbi:Anaerobic dehydrogenases, typically selenocysteine-containing [invertebrate metagenome]|uniref:Anaerobic dehydrogenases, typically selenocysteine-containing n=1 Tax=invertebrate metagenome TaxID=1711999 RepID=A0A484HA87_9ZZZZ
MVEQLSDNRVGHIRGAVDHPYTDGVVCAKVARYAERVYHPGRLMTPLRRSGPKGLGAFEAIGWEEALETVVTAFQNAQKRFGRATLWPYSYGGTMGLVQRGAIHRLRHLAGGSHQKTTICAAIGSAGWLAGVGTKIGPDPREMHDSDLIVFWGMNPIVTQINTWSHAIKARKTRGAKIVVIDPYRTASAASADHHLPLRPGTDGALACAVMHILFRDGLANQEYLARYTDVPEALEHHVAQRPPTWAAAITGLTPEMIETFAALYGCTPRSFIRFGYGMTRSRNGAVALHAASCLPAVTGAWRHRGGGALLSTSDTFHIDTTLVEANDARDTAVRTLDMSQIGRVLTGNAAALVGDEPVTAMLVQNANPAATAPESALVCRGLAREDLFLCVHEQFLTDTARFADVILPATTFLEHDDLYTSYGHTFLQIARAILPPIGESRSNHDVINSIVQRLGSDHVSLAFDAWSMIEYVLAASGLPSATTVQTCGWLDCAQSFTEQHFLTGFAQSDGRFHFAPAWALGSPSLPALPDHVPLIEDADQTHPFRLITAPARDFLNSTFSESPTSRQHQGRPTVLIHPEDCRAAGITDGAVIHLGNKRGMVTLHAQVFPGLPRGVIVVESVWPAHDFINGSGINTLTGADPVPPAGGAAFHDTAVWLRPA